MERKFSFAEKEYYHVFNRGIEKRTLFKDKDDWLRFQRLLYLCNGTKPVVFKTIQGEPLDQERGNTLVDILAYVLMSNHFHLLIHEKEKGGISKLMGKIQTAYSMYFNKKYERSGSLFCKPFRAKHVDTNEYMQWVFSYIHINPLEVYSPGWKIDGLHDTKGAGSFMGSYKYSSYIDYFVDNRPETKLLEKGELPIESLKTYNLEKLLADSSKGSPWI